MSLQVRVKAEQERRRRERHGLVTASPYSTFQEKYRHDPAGFVHDCIRFNRSDGPTVYQDQVLAELPERNRATVRGPHGLGKTALAAWCILWFALTRDGDDWKVPTTASAW